MSNFPEGLHLAYTPEETLAIFDAQDVMHVEFTDGGNGDPAHWACNIALATCYGLNITRGTTRDGEPNVPLLVVLHEYFGMEGLGSNLAGNK